MILSLRLASATLVLSLLLPGQGMCDSGPEPQRISSPGGQGPGRTIAVPAGADFQRALEVARPGDTLSLQAGATFRGPFRLPNKPGTNWIVIRGSAENQLPPPDTRVDPSFARSMPKLEASSGAVITAAPGAHHYRFVGIEIRPSPDVALENLVRLGDGRDVRKETLSSFFVIDRCYIHGDRDLGSRRGVALNSRSTEITNSYFADFKEVGADSQAIAGWGGPGPFRIVNNYLEAAGENLMFGGGDPKIAGLVPSDIEVLRNQLRKPPAWKSEPAPGKTWTVKNLLELKNARRVHIEGNLLENNWVQAQSGFAILFTVRNQDGTAPWSTVADVRFVNNVLRHAASGIYVLGQDDNHPSVRAKNIRIENNLFDDIGGSDWGGGGIWLQLIGGASDVVIDHNTAFHTDKIIMAEGPEHRGFVFSNNLVRANQYGIAGTGTGPGMPTLTKYFPGAVVRGNVIAGAPKADYPAGNFFPASLEEVGFAAKSHDAPRLSAQSRYHAAASDGRDIGVDVDQLERARASTAKPEPRADAR